MHREDWRIWWTYPPSPPPPSVVQGSDRRISSWPALRRGSVHALLIRCAGPLLVGPPPDTTWAEPGLKIEIEGFLFRMNLADSVVKTEPMIWW